VSGIAAACTARSEDVLVELLTRTIALCQEWCRHETAPVDATRWEQATRLTVR
jgi:hypothetical protein